MSQPQPNWATRQYRVALSRQSSKVELLRRDRKTGELTAKPSDFADLIAFANYLLLRVAKRNTQDEDFSTCAVLYFGLPIVGLAVFILGALPSPLRDLLVIMCVVAVTGFFVHRSLWKKEEAESDSFTERSAYVEVTLEPNLSENYKKLVELLQQSIVSEKMWLSLGDKSYEKDDVIITTSSNIGLTKFNMPFVYIASSQISGSKAVALFPTGLVVKHGNIVYYWPLDSIECTVDTNGQLATYDEGSSPSDSPRISVYWKHSRLDGGPDRRYNHNYREVLVRHEVVRIARGSQNILVVFSGVGTASKFVTILNRYCEYLVTGHSNSRNSGSSARTQSHAAGTESSANTSRDTSRSKPHSDYSANETRSTSENAQSSRQHRAKSSSGPIDAAYTAALKSLELHHNATTTDARTAYRRLSQLYHPDKVQHLAPEFREIAEKKMREINAAYDLVMKVLK